MQSCGDGAHAALFPTFSHTQTHGAGACVQVRTQPGNVAVVTVTGWAWMCVCVCVCESGWMAVGGWRVGVWVGGWCVGVCVCVCVCVWEGVGCEGSGRVGGWGAAHFRITTNPPCPVWGRGCGGGCCCSGRGPPRRATALTTFRDTVVRTPFCGRHIQINATCCDHVDYWPRPCTVSGCGVDWVWEWCGWGEGDVYVLYYL